jgi:microcystin degradation protein MlrC
MLTSRRVAPFSLGQLTSCNINPSAFQAIVTKGVHAPVAAYAAVTNLMLRVDTPGVTTADIGRLEYKNRRKPLFPFEKA